MLGPPSMVGRCVATQRGGISLRQLGALLAASLGLALLAPLVLVANHQFNGADDRRIQRYGENVAAQVATLGSRTLVTDQWEQLELVLRAVVDDPHVSAARLVGLDGRPLLTLGSNPPPDAPSFTASLDFHNSAFGVAEVFLSPAATRRDRNTLWLLWSVAALLITLAAIAGAVLAQRLEPALLRASNAIAPLIGNSAQTYPGVSTVASANALTALTNALDTLDRSLAAPPPEALAADGGIPPYLLVVNVFNQISLEQLDRQGVLRRAQRRIEKICRLYNGRVRPLSGTGLLVLMDPATDDDQAFQAICAAILILRVVTDLNHHRLRDGQPELRIRIGMTRLSSDDLGTSATNSSLEERIEEPIHRTVVLSATARNDSIALSKDVFETLAAPDRLKWQALRAPGLGRADAPRFCYLIHDVANEYESLLQRQLELLLAEPAAAGRIPDSSVG